MLEIKKLSKQYESGDIALKNFDAVIEPSEVIAIIGPSGAGKSTLIRCINRLVEPSKGQVLFENKDLTTLNNTELKKARRNMGMIFQEYALVERLTVMENVLSGRLGYIGFWKSLFRKFSDKAIQEAIQLLQELGLEDHINKRADKLSGGQRQRVGIARALIQNPDLLLVDEPTASLDPKTSRQIMRLITKLARERDLTVLLNIHDVSLAKSFANRIIGMRNGEKVYDGSPTELNEEKLTTIYGEEDWGSLEESNASHQPQNNSSNSELTNNLVVEG